MLYSWPLHCSLVDEVLINVGVQVWEAELPPSEGGKRNIYD